MNQDVLLQRGFYTIVALAGLGAMGAGLSSWGPAGLAFALFAFLTLAGALVCIWERSVVRSAFALMATFTGVAGFFALLGADFLAMAQILIYVGGILALILFGVMLTPPDMGERKLTRIGWATAIIGGGFAFVAVRVGGKVGSWAASPDELPAMETKARDIGIAFLHPEQYVVAFELAAYLLTVALVAAVYIARRRTGDFQLQEGQMEERA
ncbi:MAG: NADH-quinone oxidoreductase subunit J [bacterium]|nr:NADH-quinone oxidoreductase subunit J [bacterium]